MHLSPTFIYFADNIIIFTLCIFYNCDIAYKVGIAMAVVLDNVWAWLGETGVHGNDIYVLSIINISCESCSGTSLPAYNVYLIQPFN